jgi:hypothetical protein
MEPQETAPNVRRALRQSQECLQDPQARRPPINGCMAPVRALDA